MAENYDVVVIGGGAAGLAGATALARSRRSVLVLDAGDPRNATAGHVHNFLTRDGTPPSTLYALGTDEVTGYGGRVEHGRVTGVQRDGDAFRIDTGDRTVTARRLLVATGARDELPDVPGLEARWGVDVLHCPYCHGWEVRDRAVAVLATSAMAVHQALMWRQLTDRVTLALDSRLAPAPTDAERERLDARGVAVVEAEVARVEGEPGALVGVRLADGRLVEADAVAVGGVLQARSALLEGLGAATEEVRRGDIVLGSRVVTGPTGATTVPGVWAAGNVADPMAQVVVAAGAGFVAGAAINGDLVEEDVRNAVREYDRGSLP